MKKMMKAEQGRMHVFNLKSALAVTACVASDLVQAPNCSRRRDIGPAQFRPLREISGTQSPVLIRDLMSIGSHFLCSSGLTRGFEDVVEGSFRRASSL